VLLKGCDLIRGWRIRTTRMAFLQIVILAQTYMATPKANLKLARDLINKKDYKSAYDAASQVLVYDSSNYNGLVFLGLAGLELGKFKESEEAYNAAIRQQENQPLAWQVRPLSTGLSIREVEYV